MEPKPPPEDPKSAKRRRARRNLLYVVMAIFGVLLLHDVIDSVVGVRRIPYDQFLDAVHEKRVIEAVVGADEVEGKIKDKEGKEFQFITTKVEPKLAEELEKAGVKFQGRVESGFLAALLSWFLPILLFGGVWFFMLRAQRGSAPGFLNLGKSRARIYVEDDTKVSFADVAGVDEAKGELEEIVAFLKNPAEHGRLGGRLPRGILLVGPPGTGKTLLARAVAGEAGVPFFSISGSAFVEMFVGMGAARVRDLFEQARAKAPAIIFIDELDALGRARSASPAFGGHDEKEQTLNQLLSELDGFDPRSGIVLLGATNRPEILDPALLRSGRFDRQVLVDRPDHLGRVQILKVHLRKVKAAPSLDLDKVASLTPGFTGADLANLCNEAALVATRRNATLVELDDFTVAVERIVAGLEKKNRILNANERRIVAHHEMGHALVAAALPGTDPVHKVSVIPRGIGALGYTIQRPTEDRFLMTQQELESKMAVLLGGRAAEQIVFNHLSTGAADDLEKATRIARSMVTRYGMIEGLGHVSYDDENAAMLGGPFPFLPRGDKSDATAREIDVALRSLVSRAYERAHAVLAAHRKLLTESAELLLEKETLSEPDLKPIFERLRKEPAAP
jgi:cell division protease FtsH